MYIYTYIYTDIEMIFRVICENRKPVNETT